MIEFKHFIERAKVRYNLDFDEDGCKKLAERIGEKYHCFRLKDLGSKNREIWAVKFNHTWMLVIWNRRHYYVITALPAELLGEYADKIHRYETRPKLKKKSWFRARTDLTARSAPQHD